MRAFRDTDNREWQIRLTIGAVDRVKGEFGGKVDILNLVAGEPPLVSQLDSDPALLTHVIFGLVKLQNGGISQEQFAEAIDARVFAEAEKCFWEEITDFFQSTGRTDLVRLIEAQKQVSQETREAVKARVEEQVRAAIEKIRETSGPPSSSLRVSAG